MTNRDRVKLVAGPYKPPPLRRGDRAFCLYRDADVVVTTWSDARISWPRCMVKRRGGGSGLLVNDELARAIQTESAAAVMYWWGVSCSTVWLWRQALGVTRLGTRGSKRLHTMLSREGTESMRGVPLPVREIKRRRRQAIQLNLGRFIRPGYHGPWWTERELALLGTMSDEDVAAKINKTANAVRQKRCLLKIPKFKDRRQSR